MVERDFTAIGWVREFHNVVNAPEGRRHSHVEFDNDFLCHTADGRKYPYTESRHYLAIVGELTRFYYRHIRFGQKTIADILGSGREMGISIVGFVCIDIGTHILHILIRHAE